MEKEKSFAVGAKDEDQETISKIIISENVLGTNVDMSQYKGDLPMAYQLIMRAAMKIQEELIRFTTVQFPLVNKGRTYKT